MTPPGRRQLVLLKSSTAGHHCRIAGVMQKLAIAPIAVADYRPSPFSQLWKRPTDVLAFAVKQQRGRVLAIAHRANEDGAVHR